jgi:hypothetical protein
MPPFSGFAAPQKRSRLAISSGVLGIVALALLFGMPVSYFVVAMVGDFLGEIFAIGFLGTHLLTVAVGGLAAVALGTAALIRLGRRKEGLVGHGWAIAGLCTGPIALFVGGSVLAVGGVQMLAANDFLNWAAPVAYEAPEPLAPPTAGSADSPCSDGSDSDEPDAATVAAAPAAITASLIKAARDLLDAVADERLVPDASPVNGPLAAQEPDSPETPAQPNDSASPEGTAASAEGKTDAANATSPECP